MRVSECAQLCNFLENCPIRCSRSAHQASVLVCSSPSKNRYCRCFPHVTLSSESLSLTHTAPIEPSADANLMDINLGKKQPLFWLFRLPQAFHHPRRPCDVCLYVSGHADISRLSHWINNFWPFWSQHPLVLGYLWLPLHNPHIDWFSGKVLSWGSNCKNCNCKVFNKVKVTSLPPHHPNDCSIDWLLGNSPPHGRLYSLSPWVSSHGRLSWCIS